MMLNRSGQHIKRLHQTAYVQRLTMFVLAIMIAVSTASLAASSPQSGFTKPAYVASEGVCTDLAVEMKYKYTLGLLKQYNDNNAKGLTERQVEMIWSPNGMCARQLGATLTRTSKTEFVTSDYFGAYLTAKIKYEYGKIQEARYFTDEYQASASMLRLRAKERGWNNWIEIDRPYSNDIRTLDKLLTKLGYPPDNGTAEFIKKFGIK